MCIRDSTKGGFYELSAKVFVDASADADVATSAGVTSVYGREEDNLAQPIDVYKRQDYEDRMKTRGPGVS